jgi:hypothetical protein
MVIRIATQNEYAQLVELDHPISTEMLAHKIDQGEILVVIENMSVIGWLRYGYFWDNIPFMNMLNVMEGWVTRIVGPYFFLMNRSKLFYVRALLNTQASRQSEVSGRSARGIEQP